MYHLTHTTIDSFILELFTYRKTSLSIKFAGYTQYHVGSDANNARECIFVHDDDERDEVLGISPPPPSEKVSGRVFFFFAFTKEDATKAVACVCTSRERKAKR